MPGPERIEERLSSEDPAEVSTAMDEIESLLRRKEWDGPIPPSIVTLLESDRTETRRRAIWLIGKFAQDKIKTAYPLETVTSLCADQDEETRENAAWTIGEMAGLGIGGTEQVDRLADFLSKRPHPHGPKMMPK